MIYVRSLDTERAWWLTGALFMHTVAVACGGSHTPRRVAPIGTSGGIIGVIRGPGSYVEE